MKGGKRTNVMMDVGIRRRERRTKTRSACQGMMYGRCLHCKFAFCRMVHSLCTGPLIFLHRRHPTGNFSILFICTCEAISSCRSQQKYRSFGKITLIESRWQTMMSGQMEGKKLENLKKNVLTSKIILD
jgi:hypothetical protein